MLVDVLGYVNLLCAGVLAGEEFVIRYGVRAPVASLEERPQIQLRQSLIRRLRVLVPIVFALTAVSGIAVTILGGSGLRLALHCAGLLALFAFISITLGGTVPINQAILTWNIARPPEDWRALVNRWERLDTARTWAAISAFSLFLAAMAPIVANG